MDMLGVKGLSVRKIVVTVFFAFLIISTLLVNPARTETVRPRVIIKDDGTVDPYTAPIKRDGNTYTFTGDIYAEISVQRSNVVIDGAGHTLHGTYNGTNESAWVIGEGPDQVSNDTKVPYSIGIDLAFPSLVGLTVKNLNIKNFSIGIYVWTSNNSVIGNAVTENIVGILLTGYDNAIIGNYVARNKQGVFFGWNEPGEIPATIEIDHNSFEANEQHLSGCLCEDFNLTETTHTWDDGKEGNYWNDYKGTDANGDGIGDTPYIIDVLNRDRYPLMESPVVTPTLAGGFPNAIVFVATLAVILVIAVLALRRRKRANTAK